MDLSKYIGRTYEEYNCFDLVKEFYLDAYGIELKDYFDGDIPQDKSQVNNLICTNKGHFVKVDSPLFGDIIVINVKGISCHIGVYIDEGMFLHSSRGSGSCAERISRYQNLIEGFYRHQELAND